MVFRFGEYQLDPGRFELSRRGEPLRVEPQVLSILQTLIENRDRMVTKSELMDVVWDGRTVSESAVSSRIRSARQALEDDGRSQVFIKTIHGKGLRFIADVEEIKEASSGSGPSTLHTEEADRAPAQVRDRPSIAVLPFECLTPHPEDALFAAGLTEDIITNLSRFRDLFVFSRVTTTALAGVGLSSHDIHQRLAADFVIEGSVRKSSERVRVTFKLIDATTDNTLLVERLEDVCSLENLFDIQDKISHLIAGRIANQRHLLRVNEHEDARRLSRATKWGTYRWITQYYEYMRTRDTEVHASVREGLSEALVNDPKSSDGRAVLAVLLLDEFRFGVNARPGHPVLEEAYSQAREAVAHDQANAFAHQALAMVQYHRGEFDEFLASSDISLALNPGRADALAAFGCCYYLAGQFSRALDLLDQAIELNPMETGTPRLVRAGCHFVENRHDAALADMRQTDLPDLVWFHAYRVAIHHAAGETETALAQATLIAKEFPDFMSLAAEMKDLLRVCDRVHEKFAAAWQEVFASL